MIYHGDCLEVLRTLPDCSVDAVVTDPPYGLSFMGKKWDYDVPSEAIWRECLRVLKPGGHLLAFAGTRTQHRMAVRIEDAGFEIRDMIAWVYGSGFPKSLDVSKAIDKAAGVEREVVATVKKTPSASSGCNDGWQRPWADGKTTMDITAPATEAARQWQGWGTALKPALEPITVARKPLVGTVAENVLAHGTGALNIDGCRVGTAGGAKWVPQGDKGDAGQFGGGIKDGGIEFVDGLGRWPANLIHDGSDEVVAVFPETSQQGSKKLKDCPSNTFGGGSKDSTFYGDKGSAARFFFCARQNVSMPEVGYNEAWQDQNQNQSSALTAGQNLSLLKAVGGIVQKAVATWQSLEGILSNAQSGAFTSVTQSELKTISEVATATIASIGSGFLLAQQLEKLTPCGSRVKCAAMKEPTGTTTITTSLCKSDGCVAVVTSTITQTNLELGVAASRFNYCAKTSKSDRGADNIHPTVKPTDLMRYLCRLVTPPGGTVLDPFMGSGSTGKAAILEGFSFIGIEREAEYVEIAKARIASAEAQPKQEDLF